MESFIEHIWEQREQSLITRQMQISPHLYALCISHQLIYILDGKQSAGSLPSGSPADRESRNFQVSSAENSQSNFSVSCWRRENEGRNVIRPHYVVPINFCVCERPQPPAAKLNIYSHVISKGVETRCPLWKTLLKLEEEHH